MGGNEKLRPMGVAATIIFWAIPAAILYTAHFIAVPWFIEQTGRSYLTAYLIAYVITMAFFFTAALGAYRLEGIGLNGLDLLNASGSIA